MVSMSGFDSVLISLLTSAVVTLAIEWAAKPSLEVRKARILELSKTRHEIIRQLRVVIFLGQFLAAYVADIPSISPERLGPTHRDMTVYYNNFNKAIDSASVLFPEIVSKISPASDLPRQPPLALCRARQLEKMLVLAPSKKLPIRASC